MKTINQNSTGAEFIQDINDNFAECVAGGGDGNVSVNVPLQGGELKSSTGYVDGRWCTGTSSPYTWTDDNFYKYLHTPCYLSLKGNKIKSVSTPSGSTLTIFFYDETFTLISNGAFNAVANIPSGTVYVKFMLYNSSGFSQVGVLTLTLAVSPQWVKNTLAAYTPQFFNYDCKPPKLWEDANYTTPHTLPTDDSADIDAARYHDNGLIVLPPNYSPDGEPCKVLLWFSGDNNPCFIRHNAFQRADGTTSGAEQIIKYANANGFAYVSCGGYTSMWKDEQGSNDPSLWSSRISPAYIASVRAFYDHIMRNYNVDPAWYIAAKSAGGGMLLHTAITRPFPIRAAAGLSVVVSLFDSCRHTYVGTIRTMMKRFGCANWNSFVLSSSGSGATATLVHNASGASANQINDSNRLIADKDILRKYDAFGMNSGIDWDDFVTQSLLVTSIYNDGADYPAALTNVIFASTKVISTPIKYWCATKDPATPYTWHKIIVDWISKNGGIAEMRSYTGSDGGHGTFDGSAHAATVMTQYNGSMTVPLGIIEAVEWFKRW